MSFNFDLHIHSKYSIDGVLSPRQIIKLAIKNNLKAISVTDHNTIEGSIKVNIVNKTNLIVVNGSEVKTNLGEVIGLFITDEIKPSTFDHVLKDIRSQGGIVFLPHPYRPRFTLPIEKLSKVDFIEGINGRTSNSLNNKAQDLGIRNNIKLLASSDAHFSFEFGRVFSSFQNNHPSDVDEFREALLSENIYLTQNENGCLTRSISTVLGFSVQKIKSRLR
jgi:hypothetical protein